MLPYPTPVPHKSFYPYKNLTQNMEVVYDQPIIIRINVTSIFFKTSIFDSTTTLRPKYLSTVWSCTNSSFVIFVFNVQTLSFVELACHKPDSVICVSPSNHFYTGFYCDLFCKSHCTICSIVPFTFRTNINYPSYSNSGMKSCDYI